MSTALSTLAGPVQGALDVKKSRFLALAAPVDTPAAALAFLDSVRRADASHHCWAYRIGQHYRFSDDGEPGGTAGKPILQAIDGQGYDRVMVVVARWFGGIKLGAGGLVRAYGGCAAECLRTAPRLPIVDLAEVRVDCDFAAMASLYAHLGGFEAVRLAEHYRDDGVELHLRLPRERVAALGRYVQDLTRGRSAVRET